MSLSTSPITVSDSIAGLTITGVSIKKVDQIPDSASMLCPIIFPQPSGFISNIQPDNASFGSMGTQKANITYNLNYVFLYAEIGSGIGAFAPYKPLLQKLIETINVILNSDVVSGLVDMQLDGISGIGTVEDPSGNQYWGALFSLKCLEFTQ